MRAEFQINPEWISLYRRAFPEQEQYPVTMLKILQRRKDISAVTFVEDNQFVGLLYFTETAETIFVLFLAVDDTLRSGGYGSKILTWLKEYADGRPICLNIEPEDPEADNAEQRRRRIAFYRKNGIVPTGYYLGAQGQVYAACSSAEKFDPEAYRKAMARLSLGLYAPRPYQN